MKILKSLAIMNNFHNLGFLMSVPGPEPPIVVDVASRSLSHKARLVGGIYNGAVAQWFPTPKF